MCLVLMVSILVWVLLLFVQADAGAREYSYEKNRDAVLSEEAIIGALEENNATILFIIYNMTRIRTITPANDNVLREHPELMINPVFTPGVSSAVPENGTTGDSNESIEPLISAYNRRGTGLWARAKWCRRTRPAPTTLGVLC